MSDTEFSLRSEMARAQAAQAQMNLLYALGAMD
jgi:hypothetical protein